MLKTRLWMGALLVILVLGVLFLDQWLAPWYPFLFLVVAVFALGSCAELLSLFDSWGGRSPGLSVPKHGRPGGPPPQKEISALVLGARRDPSRRPQTVVCYGGVALLVVANWLPHLLPPEYAGAGDTSWLWIGGTFALVVLSAFVWEMTVFREPGYAVERMTLTVWIVAYLGLLPSFLAQLRFQPEASRGSWALALAIFVPKFGDMGAYFTGRFLGRHPMTPVLSPKKTWEGCAGGLAAAVLTTLILQALLPGFRSGSLGMIIAIGFGLAVGVAGILGDLAESLLKRDCQKKDASQVLPGFGGVLDVVDSIIFAAPVVYGLVRLTAA